MPSIKTIDRIALAAMMSVATVVALGTRVAQAAEPAAKLALPGGVERRFFTSGPLGLTTERVDVRADGTVVARTQVLTDGSFQAIAYGATEREVFERIGPPYRKARFPATRTTAWDYHYRDSWGYDGDFSVIFDASGVVSGKFSARDSG